MSVYLGHRRDPKHPVRPCNQLVEPRSDQSSSSRIDHNSGKDEPLTVVTLIDVGKTHSPSLADARPLRAFSTGGASMDRAIGV